MSPILEMLSAIVKTLSSNVAILSLSWEILSLQFEENSTYHQGRGERRLSLRKHTSQQPRAHVYYYSERVVSAGGPDSEWRGVSLGFCGRKGDGVPLGRARVGKRRRRQALLAGGGGGGDGCSLIQTTLHLIVSAEAR